MRTDEFVAYLILAAAVVPSFTAGCASGRNAEVTMPVDPTDACVLATQHGLPASADRLGSVKDLEWGVVPSAPLLKADPELFRHTTLLFLTEPAYRAAVAGLDEEQVIEVVRKRMADPTSYLAAMVEALGERAGELAAQAMAARPARGQQRESWDAVLRSALHAQLSCYRTGLLANYDQDEVATMIGWRASLFTAEHELAQIKGATAPMKRAAGAASDAYETTFRDLAGILADLGDPTYTELPARDVKPRLVYVAADNPYIRPKVAGYTLPAWPWNTGLLVPLTAQQFEEMPKIGPAVVMYLSAAEYSTDERLLTGAQLERELRRRFDNGGPTLEERVQHIVSLRLSLVAHLGVLAEMAQASSGGKEPAARLAAVRDRELGLAAPFLGCLERWGSKGPPASEHATRLLAELRIVEPYCRAAREEELAKCVAEMAADLERIASQLPRPAKK
jgi:hypothetical protein